MSSFQSYFELAIKTAIAAGKIAHSIYQDKESVKVTIKGDRSPVTNADLEADRYIRAELNASSPFPVISEEHIPEHTSKLIKGTYWLIDPIDGTREFIERTGEFTVNIALIVDGKVQIGVIDVPDWKATYCANLDSEAYKVTHDGQKSPLKTRSFSEQSFVLLVSRFHNTNKLNLFKEKWPHCSIKVYGSSIKFCKIAEGEGDVYIRYSQTSTWDSAAGECIIEAAGGKVITHDKQALNYSDESLANPNFCAFGDKNLQIESYLYKKKKNV